MGVESYERSAERPAPRKSGRKLLFPLVVAFAGIAILAAGLALLLLNGSSSVAASAPLAGRQLANFTLTDLSGKQIKLSDYAGRPVLINAWATWCPPCQAEMPDLNQLYLKHEAEGFTILAINAGEDRSIVNNFIQQKEFGFPVLLDPQAQLLNRWGVRDYPTSIVVGRDGKVKLLQVGVLTPDAIKNVVEPLITQ